MPFDADDDGLGWVFMVTMVTVSRKTLHGEKMK